MLGAARVLPSRKAEASSMQVFPQNVIAMVWDFDWTLIRGHMQAPLFRDYGIDPTHSGRRSTACRSGTAGRACAWRAIRSTSTTS